MEKIKRPLILSSAIMGAVFIVLSLICLAVIISNVNKVETVSMAMICCLVGLGFDLITLSIWNKSKNIFSKYGQYIIADVISSVSICILNIFVII